MAQFTPTSLARLLENVDRDILREAVEIAELWDVFSSFERSAIEELGKEQNLMANLKALGPSALQALGHEFFERVEKATLETPILVRLQFEAARKTFELVVDIKNFLAEFFPEEAHGQVTSEAAEVFKLAMGTLTLVRNELVEIIERPAEITIGHSEIFQLKVYMNRGIADMNQFRTMALF